MEKAQQRDAALSGRFHFRKDVFPPGQSSPSSSAASCSSGTSSPTDDTPRPKEKKLRNCFPPLPLPENGVSRGPVEDEYEEMSMDEIMNGKVGLQMR